MWGDGRLRKPMVLTALGVLLAALLQVVVSTTASAADPCGTGGNAIACENSKPGADDWDVTKAGDDELQGFSTDISVNVGQRIDFKIDSLNSRAYGITIYRIGYYGGKGARLITTVPSNQITPRQQPQCYQEAATELYDCGNWSVSASWNVPSNAVSGVYVAKLQRPGAIDGSHITFVVRNDSSTSDVVFQTSDTTWQAYNTYGGSNFYQGGANGRAYKLSYNRPITTRGTTPHDAFFANEYPMVRFLERNGYDTTYIAGVDSDRRGHLIKNHKVFLSVGHDEYWSGKQRDNVQAARDAGVHLQFLAGNEMYWRVRYEPSSDASHTPYRTLVSYKETWNNAKIDPSTEWTGTWRDPRFASRANGGGLPENGLIGTAYMVNFSDLAMKVTAAEGKLRLWRNTSIANLTSGSATLAPHTVGYESNEVLDNADRPPGLIKVSTTTGAVPEYLQDYGTQVAPGTTTHNMTMYRAPSGAIVFSAGTVQWTWGLDEEHDSDYAPEPADVRMQQAQVNLFADMGVQPVTRASNLVAAATSADTRKPTVTIISPASGQAQKNGDKVTVTGTASDVGGRVAAVEYSTDGGQSWLPATGTTSWSFSFIQHGRGSTPVRVRAIDDSLNMGNPTSRSFSVTCPCSVFGQTVPDQTATPDTNPVELGLKFTPTREGFVNGVRFYKGTGNGGTHVGSLWSPSGERLATVTFTNETATGWQSANFAQAVPVEEGRTYTVSYTAPQGRYAVKSNAFTENGYDANLLKVVGGFGTQPAGVYGTPGTLPTQSYMRANYFVDVSFVHVDDSPLSVTSRFPAADATNVPATTAVTAKFSKPVVASTATITVKSSTGATIAGSTTYDSATRTATFTPSSPLAAFVLHTVTVTGTDAQGGSVGAGGSWTFRTARPTNPPGVCPCSLFDEDTLPTVLEDTDTGAVSVGVRFSSDVNGMVTGIRFYKSAGNTGAHVGTLWNQNGVELASGTFTNETPTGWQELTFATPVQITKNVDYTVSYRALNGRYSATPNAFATSNLSKPPLRVSSTAGAYSYGTGFPAWSSPHSYLVDVIFERTPAALSVTTQDPAPGAVDVPRSSKVKVGFSTDIASGWSLTVRNGATTVAGTAVRDPGASGITWTPAQKLPAGADLTVTLSGVVSAEGATLPSRTWTFRTRDAESTSNQTLFGDELPDVAAADDASAIELGTEFTPSRDGVVKAVRYFKGPGNAGSHTGSIWTLGGSRLATVEFTGETSNGWQTATLAQPLAVSAGTTYVVSYFAPQGRYSVTSGFFSSPWTKGDLTAGSGNNGRYAYGGGYPAYSFGATNYFVDVVFERALPTLTATGRTPAAGSEDVALTARPSLSVSVALASGWSMTLRTGSTTVAGSAALSGDGKKLTFDPAAALEPETDYTVTVSGLTSTEGATLATQTWTFRTGADPNGTTSLLTGLTPAVVDGGDVSAVEVGTVFTPDVDGTVEGVRFYKAPTNTGTHTGSVWTMGGQRLGSVTFTGETASGWQTATFDTPVEVEAGTSYVVSYYAPNGHYSVTGAFFGTPHVVGPLTAPAGPNGRYAYGAGGGFPTNSWNSTNYFVDVVFKASSP